MSLLSRLAVQAARAYGILSSADKNKVVADYLVVAGGGGGAGGTAGGGGGGAGGLLTSTATLSTLNTYSIAVGAGGNGGAVDTIGSLGSNSVISGTGLSTVTATGGGYGGYGNVAAGAGGSGGGGGGRSTTNRFGGAGTSGQGSNGGDGLNDATNQSGAGGGGAGAVGGAASGSSTGGAGGNGVASSISGSSVTYAGGGGGAGYYNTSYGTTSNGGLGGSGGGGTANSAGTANLGGGGGGGGGSAGGGGAGAGAAGGSGIVIISYTATEPKFVGGTITTSGGKQIHTFTSSGTLSPITPITASYLVVAGGGGGGTGSSGGQGGGGAGGLLTSSTTLYSGATYVVTVGAGGTQGVNGSNSVVSGTGLTTLTAIGGGYGGSASFQAGNSGGSGGGGSEGNNSSDAGVGGAGTSGQGYAGGKGAGATGGGGGGAGAVGSAAQSPTYVIGNGGIGVQSSISGTATYYAGGGGGSGYGPYTGSTTGVGGQGGGGTGASGQNGSLASAGTPNTGGGGGAKNTAGTGSASGGSGIVIISYAGSQAFNGGLVTTSGGNTIHTFTSTGALTPLTNNLNNSLRFRSSASAYLNRTPTVAGNRQKWTISVWVKRGTLGVDQKICSAYSADSDSGIFDLRFTAGNVLYFGYWTSAQETTSVYRDPSAWYHIVAAVDTTQATAANRVKMYVNGNQVTLSGAAFAQNTELAWNNNVTQNIGRQARTSDGYFDGYLSDFYSIDGQALEPYYFGNNDANGVWKPIQYKGTYGTNGFYLTFGNTTSTTTLGYDSSPNGNNWTCNNISLTAGVTYDAMTDSPTNTSATVANYPTLNPLSNTSTLTEANLSASNILLAGTTMATPSTGKWYFEYTQTTSIPSGSLWVGVSSNTNAVADNQLQGYAYASDGRKVAYNSYTSGYGATWTNGDVIGCALDLDNQTITFYKNNVSQGTAFTSITAQPYVFALSAGGVASTKGGSINCGQRPFSYTPPTGYVALNTYNLPTPTILQGNKYMDATLYTGNGYPTGGTQVVVNAGQFKPDLIWVKERSGTGWNIFTDSVRGLTKNIYSNSTNAEGTNNGTDITAINSNGFSLGADTGGDGVNRNGATVVAWQWQAGQGSTSSNTSGSITSTVSVNTTAGFSIVTYTGTGANATVGHGLGVAPKMIIIKNRDGSWDWIVYHASLSNTQYLFLNSTAAAGTATTVWNSTSPTSSVFSLGSAGTPNNNGNGYVAYCWAEIAGFSKFTSYTGNGSTDGPFIYLGFRPKFILARDASVAGQEWTIYDTSRSVYNQVGNKLSPDLSAAETVWAGPYDILSNGFKLRTTDIRENRSGSTFIVAAFAEHPFKNSNAR